ncbi:hypothetical protein FB451DRAFT_1172260 [Mycena latifolia]|nr:hypothetical protein FB451DRAFT_1172260 [Mycena latifolia]
MAQPPPPQCAALHFTAAACGALHLRPNLLCGMNNLKYGLSCNTAARTGPQPPRLQTLSSFSNQNSQLRQANQVNHSHMHTHGFNSHLTGTKFEMSMKPMENRFEKDWKELAVWNTKTLPELDLGLEEVGESSYWPPRNGAAMHSHRRLTAASVRGSAAARAALLPSPLIGHGSHG